MSWNLEKKYVFLEFVLVVNEIFIDYEMIL